MTLRSRWEALKFDSPSGMSPVNPPNVQGRCRWRVEWQPQRWAGGVLTSVLFPADETAEQHDDAKKPRTDKGEGGLQVLNLNRVLFISL